MNIVVVSAKKNKQTHTHIHPHNANQTKKKLCIITKAIFTGSPRPYGHGTDTTGYGMMYNNMQHASGTPNDFYGRAQTGKTGHKF
jgi:hypothetical protein